MAKVREIGDKALEASKKVDAAKKEVDMCVEVFENEKKRFKRNLAEGIIPSTSSFKGSEDSLRKALDEYEEALKKLKTLGNELIEENKKLHNHSGGGRKRTKKAKRKSRGHSRRK